MPVIFLAALTVFALVTIVSPTWTLAANDPHVWRSIGPSAIANSEFGWASGRISDLTIGDDETAWIATANGGIWKRGPNDQGWVPRNDGLTTLAFGSITHYGNTFYAASGEDHGCIDCPNGRGVFKSVNGSTWTLLPQSPAERSAVIRIGSTDGKVLWVGGDRGLSRSDDSGATWKTITRVDPLKRTQVPFEDPRAIVVLPDSKGVIVGDYTGLYRSTDDGENWVVLPINPVSDLKSQYNGTGMDVAIAVAPNDPSELIASFAVDGTNYAFGCLAGLYVSHNSGDQWTRLDVDDYFAPVNYYAHGNALQCQGWYDNAVAISPVNSNEIAVGGITIMRTTDGHTWENLAREASIHPDVHALVYDNVGNLYVANDGGVLELPKGGNPLNLNQSLSIAQFYGGGSVASATEFVLGGTQDNGTIAVIDPLKPTASSAGLCSTPSAGGGSLPYLAWLTILTGDGGATAVNPADSRQMYAEYNQGDLQSTTDGGCNWVDIAPQVHSNSVAWVMPYVVTDNWETIIAGADQLYETTTGGLSRDGETPGWTTVNVWPTPDPTTTNLPYVTALWSNHDGAMISAGRDDGSLAKLFPGSKWELQTLDGQIDTIVVDPNDNKHAFIGVENPDNDCNIEKTTDFNDVFSTWSSIKGDIPDCFGTTLALSGGRLYAATSRGVYVRTTESHWEPAGNDLPIVPVVALLFPTPTSMIVLTHGRGAWYLPAISP